MNIEYKDKDGFKNFFDKVEGKVVALIYDFNTQKYAFDFKTQLVKCNVKAVDIFFNDRDFIPTSENRDHAVEKSKGCDYVLAVGSGSLNDMTKSVATILNIPCGVLATAASMDGYCSKGAALMYGGEKRTDVVKSPEDILIDADIIKNAPRIMTAAGFGDIIGKYTCLTDWKLSNIINGEPINREAYEMMEKALSECVSVFEDLTVYDGDAVVKLMNALVTAGVSMAICGNSRPASGSEHHQSHFLEMDFVRRGEKIPMHGLKVAIGTLVSLEIYNYIKYTEIEVPKKKQVYSLIDELPEISRVKYMLEKMGCPTRFSELGVRKETFSEMLEKAYLVRDRYTVLTLAHELGITEGLKPVLTEKYF